MQLDPSFLNQKFIRFQVLSLKSLNVLRRKIYKRFNFKLVKNRSLQMKHNFALLQHLKKSRNVFDHKML